VSQDRKLHWEGVYKTKQFTDVSWYQQLPARSLELIDAAAVGEDAPIIDIGGGASTLVDHLIARGYRDVTVLDIAEGALAQARSRLAGSSHHVHWIVSDVVAFRPERSYRLWHDRAVLHFLVDAADRQRYLAALRAALVPGGDLVLASFGPDGPLKCSGLEVRRYSLEMMAELLGPEFELQSDDIEFHRTPSGGEQQFLCTRWRRLAQ
jgi:trans-aconitate methyltransferase